ncbi:hypothetical protein BUALT_Bualt12G0134000 [Buddleja alternifolia]|uniref:FLZ-type domain-containing protein n=1 Tax=Buddleja alternifolia TaxID=168488 RepID=A0AAV6WVY0_9LAMI|nr:hypothetical protein BUALT_Bualt12G0134000 [Buddleja alternifolia]
MAENGFLQAPKDNYKQPISSVFNSPKLFTNFVSKSSNDTNDQIMSSPTSILDTKTFSPASSSNISIKQENKCVWEKLDSKGVGLALVDSLIDEKPDSNLSKMVILGSQLKIQVPPLFSPVLQLSPNESPKSPCDFGIKTRNFVKKSSFGSFNSDVFSSLSASEMELSEDYTCVISYGPNPKITHIFDDCIVESCCGVVKLSESRTENGFSSDGSTGYPSESFLSFCYKCRKNLGQGKDIYMYRFVKGEGIRGPAVRCGIGYGSGHGGEKGFCSSECRCKEIMLDDEGMEFLEPDNVYGTS